MTIRGTTVERVQDFVVRNPKLCRWLVWLLIIVTAFAWGAHYERKKTAYVGACIASTNEIQNQEGIQSALISTSAIDTKEQGVEQNIEQDPPYRMEYANEISRLLYGYQGYSSIDLEGICWVVLNRVDYQYGYLSTRTLKEVITCPNQWIGYSEQNPVSEDLYKIANKVILLYESGKRSMFGPDFLYFECLSDHIVFKTELYDSDTCISWRNL